MPQIKKCGHDPRHAEPGTGNAGRRRPSAPAKRKAIDVQRSRPAEPDWPALPGENAAENAADAPFAAAWPSLPHERFSSVKTLLQQMETRLSEAAPREAERLQRLDEEHKGVPWNASHF
jgi:hypothetical protein